MKDNVSKYLLENEEICKKAQTRKPSIVLPMVILWIIIAVCGFLFLSLIPFVFTIILAPVCIIGSILPCNLLVVSIVLMILIIKKSKHAPEIIITNKRIVGDSGCFLSYKVTSIALDKIQSVTIKSSMEEKDDKYGVVLVGTAHGMVKFANIKNPKEFRKALLEQIENR